MSLKYRLLLLYYVLPLAATCQSPGLCATHSYQKIYSTTESSELFDVVETSDGGKIVVGYIGQMVIYSYTTDSKALIMKLDNAGNQQWAKGIKALSDNYFKKVRQTTDGGFIAVGVTKPFGAAIGHILLIRFDQSGAILWSRSMGNTIYDIEHVLDVIQTSDGGFVLTGIQGQFLADQTVVIRTDANGALLWEKNYGYVAQDFSFPGGIVEENDSLVVAGSREIYYPATEKYVYLMKVNKNTGDVFWAKECIGGGDWYPMFNKSNGGYYMDHPVLPGDATITKMDLSGNPIKTFDIHAYTQGSDFRYFPTADDGVIVSKKSTVLNLIKVRPDNTLEWANEYPVPSPSSWLTCVKVTPTNQVIATGSLYYSSTHIDFILINKSVNGIDSCPGLPITPVSTTVKPYLASPFTWSDVTSEPAFSNTLINTIVTPEIFTVTNLCSTTILPTCGALKLSGTDSVCVNMDTLIFLGKRAPGCTTPVLFQLDPSLGAIIYTTDSTASIVFKQVGNVKLFAGITTPCGVLKDSVLINIFASPGPVNLGVDRSICQNSSIILHAGKDYRTYQWQDGSTDSIFVVTDPGQYYVVTTDHCGDTFRDTVTVSAVPSLVLDLGSDASKCNKDTIAIAVAAGFNSYSWTPDINISNTSGRSVKVWPNVTTTYTLTVTNAIGCSAVDSIKIAVYNASVIDLGNDTSFCQGNTITLNAGPGFVNYQWNTGATSPQLLVGTAGQFSVIGTDNHQCRSFDTLKIISVFANPVPSLQKVSVICQGTSLLLDAGAGYVSYHWQDGSSLQRYSANAAGKYWITVTDTHQCRGSDSTEIKQVLPLPVNFVIPDTSICEGQIILLKSLAQYSQYLWSTGSLSNQINISSAGSYWLQVTGTNNCVAREFINVASKNCVKAVYIPNAFSPNRDGVNEVFRANAFGPLKSFHLMVYGRLGQKVFETFDVSLGWDGRYKGVAMESGIFVWYVEYQLVNDVIKKEKGTITLIR
jgi:gliding motility-associated-like protein